MGDNVTRFIPKAEREALAMVESHALNVEALQEIFNEFVQRYKNGQTVQFAILEFGPTPRVDVFQYIFGNEIDDRIVTACLDEFREDIRSGEFGYEYYLDEEDDD